MKRVAVELSDDLPRHVGNSFKMHRPRGREEGGKEFASWRQGIFHFDQTAPDVIGIKMGENRNRQRVIKLDSELRQVEAVRHAQVRLLVYIGRVLEQFLPARLDQRGIKINPAVMPLLKVRHKMHPTPQTAAANIDHPMLRRQALLLQELKLQRPNLIPHPAHELAMRARADLGIGQLFPILVFRLPILSDGGMPFPAAQQFLKHGWTMTVYFLASSGTPTNAACKEAFEFVCVPK